MGFWAILRKMLAKKPEDRYATPADLLHDLNRTRGEATSADAAATQPQRKTEYPPNQLTPPPMPSTVHLAGTSSSEAVEPLSDRNITPRKPPSSSTVAAAARSRRNKHGRPLRSMTGPCK